MRLRKGQVWLGVLFLILGILFILRNLGFVTGSIWSFIWKFWPLILVLIGLEILITNRLIRGLIVVLFIVAGIILAVNSGKIQRKTQKKFVEKGEIAAHQYVIKEDLKNIDELEVSCKNLKEVDIKMTQASGTILSAKLTLRSREDEPFFEDSVKFNLEINEGKAVLNLEDLRDLKDAEDVLNKIKGTLGRRYTGILELEVPRGLSVSISNISGDLTIDDYEGNEMKVNFVDGDMKLQGLKLSNLELIVVNGDISLENVMVKNVLKISAVNGDGEWDNVKAREISFEGVNGELHLGENLEFEKLNINLLNGDVEAVITKKWLKGYSRVSAVHGDITLIKRGVSHLPISIKKGVTRGKEGSGSSDARIFVETLTGSVNIED